MGVFDELGNSADKGADIGKKYFTTSYKYFKLKLFKLITSSISVLAKLLIIGVLFSLGLLFLAFSVAHLIGNYLDNIVLGYLFVGLFLLLMALFFYFFRRILDKKVLQKMSKMFFDL